MSSLLKAKKCLLRQVVIEPVEMLSGHLELKHSEQDTYFMEGV